MAGLADEREAHGSFGHGELAVFIPRRRPPELPQLLGHGEEQRHGHQAGGQGGQSRDEVETVEQHDDGEPVGLSGALDESQKKSCAEAFLDFGGKMCKSRSKFLEVFFFFFA